MGFAITLSVIPGTVFASCGTAFCSINTQWDVQGVSMDAGTRVGLRYEYIDQDQLRAGVNEVAVGEIPHHHDEVRTLNKNWLFSVDHTFNDSWGASLIVPYVDRSHEHIHNHMGTPHDEAWDFGRLGDARILGRYKPLEQKPGFLFGLKLPTGKYDIANEDGDEAERTLQPGTGTTDVILGIFYGTRSLSSPSLWFVQASWQQVLNERADFKPGHQLLLDGGYRYDANHKVGLMVQINGLIRDKDSGDEAEPDDSGGEYLYLSPGVSLTVSHSVQVFAFLQQPLYQHVNGVQLTADNGYVLGINGQF